MAGTEIDDRRIPETDADGNGWGRMCAVSVWLGIGTNIWPCAALPQKLERTPSARDFDSRRNCIDSIVTVGLIQSGYDTVDILTYSQYRLYTETTLYKHVIAL